MIDEQLESTSQRKLINAQRDLITELEYGLESTRAQLKQALNDNTKTDKTNIALAFITGLFLGLATGLFISILFP